MQKQFFVVRLDEDNDYVDDWDGVADSFDSRAEAETFVKDNASAHPGVKYVIAQAVAIGEAPLPEVVFTEVAPATQPTG